jgi:hypothetical protein
VRTTTPLPAPTTTTIERFTTTPPVLLPGPEIGPFPVPEVTKSVEETARFLPTTQRVGVDLSAAADGESRRDESGRDESGREESGRDRALDVGQVSL